MSAAATLEMVRSCLLHPSASDALPPGNFHALLMFQNDEELSRVHKLVHNLVHRALRMDGTCASSLLLTLTKVSCDAGTGEHGVGVGKKEYLEEELGAGTIKLMKAIKRTVDPMGIMNPGKVRQSAMRLE